MSEKFMNEASDVQWLLDTALKGVQGIPAFRSFVLFGNEDAPDKVHLYASQDPNFYDRYTRVDFSEPAPVYCTVSEEVPRPRLQAVNWGPSRTRADFYAQGQKSARMGNTRTPGNEYRMPVFGTGSSWQARAFAEGFRDECARMGRKVTGA